MSLVYDHKATLKVSQSLLVLLTSWYQSLDPFFHTTTAEDLSGEPDPRFLIHLSYHAVKITILRALLRPFYRAGVTAPNDPIEHAEWESAKYHVSGTLDTECILFFCKYSADNGYILRVLVNFVLYTCFHSCAMANSSDT